MLTPINRKYFRLSVNVKKDTDIDMSANCPLCGDTKNRLHLFEPAQTGGIIKCFNSGCQAEDGMSLLRFMESIASPHVASLKRELFQTNINSLKDQKSTLSMKELLCKVEKVETKSTKIPEAVLEKFVNYTESDVCTQYIRKRGVTPGDDWMYAKNVQFPYKGKTLFLKNSIVIPIYYANKYKGLYVRNLIEKNFYILLQDNAEKIWSTSDQLEVITEGIWDALSTGFVNVGAMLGADLSQEYLDLNKTAVFAFDNDKTGVRKSIKYALLGYKIFVWPEIPFKDFNEMVQKGWSTQDIKKMILDNTWSGLLATTRLKMKNI